MKYPIPSWLMPVNIFEIAGNMCCANMYNAYLQNNLARHFNCFNASSLFEANACVVWGGISPKLAVSLEHYVAYLPKHHFAVHIQGCQGANPSPQIRFQRIVDQCELSKQDLRQTIVEARQCLMA